MDLKNANVTVASEASETVTAMRKKNRSLRTYDIIMGFITVLFGCLFYFTLSRSIENSAWLWPLLTFTPYIISYLLLAVTSGIKKVALAATALSFVTSLLFEFHIIHMGVILLAMLIVWRSIIVIRHTLFSGIKVESGNAMYMGIMGFITATALIISSQYYFTITRFNSDQLVDRIANSNTSTINITKFFFDYINAKNSTNTNNTIGTVDGFLEGLFVSTNKNTEQKQNMIVGAIAQSLGISEELVTQIPGDLTNTITEDSFLRESRKILSKNVGIALNGSEDILDVLTTFFKLRAEKIIRENETVSYTLPIILSFFFFITIFSVGSVLRYPWIWIAKFIFWILKIYDIIKIIHVEKQVEVIKY